MAMTWAEANMSLPRQRSVWSCREI